MKLQIALEMVELDFALEVAQSCSTHADILEIGTPLIYRYGIGVIEQFKNTFPTLTILADTKIVDNGKDIVTLAAQAGADWVTVMAGTSTTIIHTACTTANDFKIKVMLDLLDASSSPQLAMEAQNLGASALLFHPPTDERELFVMNERWDVIQGNASVPVFIATTGQRPAINHFLAMKPYGLVIGKAITEADDPAAEAAFYASLMHN
jgi:3-hexulose-6-phosphate synthase